MEPDASWYRLSNHRPPIFPSTYEQAADEKRKVEQASVKEFFYNFLQKADEAQTEIFKAVMETPAVKTIEALLRIPFIPQMIREEREKEGERLNKMSDREFCEWAIKRYKKTFSACVDYYKDKEKNNQSIEDTQ